MASAILFVLNLVMLALLVYLGWRGARGLYRLLGRIPALGPLVAAASSPTIALGDCPTCGSGWVGWLSDEWARVPVWACMVDRSSSCGAPDRLTGREAPPLHAEGIDPTVSHAERAVLRAYSDDEVIW